MSEVSLEGMSPEAIHGLAILAKGLSQNEKTRGEFLRLTKAANPSLSIPEVDIPASMNVAMEAEREERRKLEAKIAEQEARENVRARRDSLMKTKGLTDADMAEVEKLMVDKQIPSHETAAEFLLAQRQSAKPTPMTIGNFGSHQAPSMDLKQFGGNISQWARNEAVSTLNDIRSGRIAV